MTSGWLKHRLGSFELELGWAVAPGQIMTLFGPSGAGKSTALRALAGLLTPTAGHIEIGGEIVFDSARQRWLPPHLRRVGYLPQQLGLFPHLTIAQNVAFGLPRADAALRVRELLELLQIGELASRYPQQVSVGQQQRAALARALAPRPALLLLDEPFSALDAELRRELRRELRAVRDREQLPMLLVTHDVEDALALSDMVLVLDHGRIVAQGPPVEVLERPSVERLSRLIEVENIFQGRVVQAAPDSGLTCDLGGVALELPYAKLAPGAAIRVGIRAGDIMLATAQPRGLSARNLLPGRVLAVEPKGFGFEARVDCGPLFRVQVTRHAVETLQLAPGQPLWLVIKSNSCFVIE